MKQGIALNSIVIGYPHGREVAHAFMKSLLTAITQLPPGMLRAIQSVSAGAFSLDRARNEIVDRFLETDAEWLLFIDTDMQFTAEDILRVLKTAHPQSRPVVGGLCFKLQGVNEDFGAVLVPTLYRYIAPGEPDALPVLNYGDLEQVDATGAAFLLVHREVFTKIGGDWFSHHPDQKTASEDWAFSLRLRDHGIPLYVDTRAKIGHEKAVVFTERDYFAVAARVKAAEAVEA